MKTAHTILIIFLVFFSNIFLVTAQTLSPQVISTSGGFYTNANAMLSFTTGELTMVKSFNTTTAILNQGFQQFFDTSVGIYFADAGNQIALYPNPTAGELFLSITQPATLPIDVAVYNAVGQMVISKTILPNQQVKIFNFSLVHLNNGLYHVRIQSPSYHYTTKIILHK